MNEEFVNNWKSMKPLFLARWSKIKESELPQNSPSIQELIDLIKRHYPKYEREEILQDLENFNEQIL